ncbi:MAG: [protein-PII] uridylyltransferase [Verrucomicrobia bacterium]|nr:[protein-PII] uridylyltransferase [Verrucomicrobiota bacterium]
MLAKIEAEAAEKLPLPPGRTLEQEKARYRNFIKLQTHRLKFFHRGGGSGSEVCRGRATMMDALMRHLMDGIHQQEGLEFQRLTPSLSLVAIGGYGRGELNPYSDVDIMLLHTQEANSGKGRHYLAKVIDTLIPIMWDVHLKPGQSVRTVTDCVEVANKDMQSKTSLIEARPIWGNGELFKLFQETLLAKCIQGYEAEYIAARVRDQAVRHAKYGNSATMQEPNVKNGCGGLRDYQNLLWMAFFKYRTRTLADLVQRELISQSEARKLEKAYDFLLRVRNELHYTVNRSVDVLAKNVQPAVAKCLGYTERSPSQRIERFLSDYFNHSRNIYLITSTVEQRLALTPKPGLLPSLRAIFRTRAERMKEQLFDGFKFTGGEICAATPRVFRDQPARLMRVFLYAQQRGLKLHPALVQLLRQSLQLLDRSFTREPHVRDTFLEILNQRGSVAPILRLMHDVGFLGKYLPEFGKLTALVQHEFYHQYTTDEHTLMCLEKLDQVWEAKEPPFCHYAEMFRNLERPFVLYLALLLHDAGKARANGNHAVASSQMAQRVARRLRLDTVAAESLRVVIENHLAMAIVSQRRDLDDPAVARDFAALVKNAENLTALTLHTLADSLGTSDKLWNGFKDTLLLTLYQRSRETLAGVKTFLWAEERQRSSLRDEVRRLLPRTLDDDEVEAHFQSLPARYFLVNTAREIGSDLALAHRFMHLQLGEGNRALDPTIEWHNEPDRGYTRVKLCTWDRPGLFWRIAGSFSAAGLNILGAQIFSRADGIALDTFFVTDAATGTLVKRESHAEFETVVNQALSLEGADLRALIANKKAGRPFYQSVEDERIPTRIDFDNRTSANRTVIEIETEDRLGLLYAVAETMAGLGLDISVAKIVTEKGAAIDSFYVREPDGQQVLEPERQRLIAEHLRTAIGQLDLQARAEA